MNHGVKRNIHIESQVVHERLRAIRETRLCVDQRTFASLIGISQPVLSKWERGEYRPPALALMKIGDLSIVDRRWWYEQAGPQFAERLSDKAESTTLEQKREETALDPELLAQVLEAVEAAMNKTGGFFSTQIRAEILAKVYDRWQKTKERDCSFIDGLVNRTRGPSNRKVKTR